MDGNIKIFSNSTYQLLHTIEGHAMPIRSITFSPDSQFMMSASDDGHIKGKTGFFHSTLFLKAVSQLTDISLKR